jgi:thiopurine S-methyltransferase
MVSKDHQPLDAAYWQSRYQSGQTGWDMGMVSPPIKQYIDQLEDKGIKVLIPGAGNAYEAEYLFKAGFDCVDVLDIAQHPLDELRSRVPDFSSSNLIQGDFFDHNGKYDLIIEQTFFCAIDRALRSAYAEKCHDLLKEGGIVAGLFWSTEMSKDSPPFGGSKEEYLELFSPYFDIVEMDISPFSIGPRSNRELFFEMKKPPSQ